MTLNTARQLSALPIRRNGKEVAVAFSDPEYGSALQEIEAILELKVVPCLAPRKELEEAIQRILGRKNIGTYLLMAGLISRSQLNDALDLAKRTGVRLGRALLNRGYIDQDKLYQFLAEQANLPFVDLENKELKPEVYRLIDPDIERIHGILPLDADEERLTLAVVDPFNREAITVAEQATKRSITPVLVTEVGMESALEKIYSSD
jgi:type II secretory ATPase GspE/PulE/Tfp pilus assembly ATPase PilB-like protein